MNMGIRSIFLIGLKEVHVLPEVRSNIVTKVASAGVS